MEPTEPIEPTESAEPATPLLRIELVYSQQVCYAMQQNHVPIVQLLRVINDGPDEVHDLVVTVDLLPDLAQKWTRRIASIAPGGICNLADVAIEPRPEALIAVAERQRANLRVEVRNADSQMAEQDHSITLLAYNEWPGARSVQSLLAAFVLPNNPAVVAVLRDASARLATSTGSAALDGYQSRDPERAKAIAQAVFAALQARGLVYVNPPASFEQEGQKVRTPDQVLHEGMGTCLDLALLYAACLEQIGLHPLLIVEEGHALAGCWLTGEMFAEVSPADPLPLRKRVELDLIMIAECTMLCATQARPFAAALERGSKSVAADGKFLFAVDVAMARRSGVRPLPLRAQRAPAAELLATAVLDEEETATNEALQADAPAWAMPAPEPEEPQPKQDRVERWQRRLLDLTLRNRLLNFVPSKRTLPMMFPDLTAWESALRTGTEFRIHPRPKVAVEDGDGASPEGAIEKLLASELRSRRLHSDLDQDQLDARMVEIWRQTRIAQEESGVSTLFLAVGFLRWYESPSSKDARRAPLLLLPLRMERISVAEGFRIALADEEARINDTLVQKLDHDFGIRVRGLDRGHDEDESGEGHTVADVLAAFRRAVVDVDRWEVESVCWIGNFSFAKYLMWRDLDERRAAFLEHGFLRHLIETPQAGFDDGFGAWPMAEGLDERDPQDHLSPLDADSSQMCAIEAAVTGRSFVLEGPPGTGKSQTITNLIAQCMGRGQRVLFVAEKRAALEVVQKRLAAVGLAPFCLELHSGKGSKRDFVQQLGRALEMARTREPRAWRHRAEELQQARTLLNAHVESIHRRRKNGMTVFAATALLVARRSLPVVDGLPVDIDEEGLAHRRDLVARLAHTAAPLGDLEAHPWFGVRRTEWHPGLGRELEPLLQDFASKLPIAGDRLGAAARAFGLQSVIADAGRAPLAAFRALLEALALGPVLPGLVQAEDFVTARKRIVAWMEKGRRRADLWSGAAKRFTAAVLDLDLADLHARLLHWRTRFVLLRWWKLRPVRKVLASVGVGGVAPRGEQLDKDLAAVADVQLLTRELTELQPIVEPLLGEAFAGFDSDWSAIAALVGHSAHVRKLADLVLQELSCDRAAFLRCCGALAGAGEHAATFASAMAAHDDMQRSLVNFVEPLQLDLDRAFGVAEERGFLARAHGRVTTWQQSLPMLREQCAFQRDAQAVSAAALLPMVVALEGRVCTARQLPDVFERSYAEAWIAWIMQQEPRLATFRGVDHEAAIDRFRKLDRELIGLAGKVVQARLGSELPTLRTTSAVSSELGILLRELKKQRRHLSPRQLFQRIPNLLSKLSPCLLMSPMTVAQVLGHKVEPFDIAVFDEASQVPVWDAVGAISRARALVVVGDSKQLPPTTFFQRMDDEDDDNDPHRDGEQVEELESVLDECAAAGLERLSLRWHYRSRHESLIAFSNHHYYDNRLLTFPSPDCDGDGDGVTDEPAAHRGLGVKLVQVEGVYDRARSQTNQKEAEALVAELVRRLRDPREQGHSFGVVTFSMVQQVLVEDLLDRARREHPEIEAHFSSVEEPVFVKNLENVQGDERDVMLFSICYGPDAAGKVHMHFGPLNRQGGERRLNVAVTRARRELRVFSSLRADQIELSRTNSLGVRHLRAFLDYAARGARAIVEAVSAGAGAAESPFELQVQRALEERGYVVHCQIGCSGYRIDLAVVDPRRVGRYLLGIECDGASYHSAATARDRDRLRQSVLEELGWRIQRVWSTDWWLDPDGEIDRLQTAVENLLAEPLPEAPADEPADESIDESTDQPTDEQAEEPAEVPVAEVDDKVAAEEPDEVVVELDVAPDPEPDPEPEPEPEPESAPEPEPTSDLPLYTPKNLPTTDDVDAFYEKRNSRKVIQQVRDVLDQEAPIVFDVLARRIADAWGVTRLTDRVRARVHQAIVGVDPIDRYGALWPRTMDPAEWAGFRTSPAGHAAREAEQLPITEVDNAMAWLLAQHGSLDADDLLRETARLFGITRLGRSVRAAMQAGLDRLIDAQRAAVDGEIVREGQGG